MSDVNTKQDLDESQKLVEYNNRKISVQEFEERKNVVNSSPDMKLIQEGPAKYRTRIYG